MFPHTPLKPGLDDLLRSAMRADRMSGDFSHHLPDADLQLESGSPASRFVALKFLHFCVCGTNQRSQIRRDELHFRDSFSPVKANVLKIPTNCCVTQMFPLNRVKFKLFFGKVCYTHCCGLSFKRNSLKHNVNTIQMRKKVFIFYF